MLLGIGLHVSLAYFPAPWSVQDRYSSDERLFDEFLWAVHGFRMPVFFLMSGFFTALLWRRRGLRALMDHRLRRVALPLLLGMLTIVPLNNLISEWAAESAPEPEAPVDLMFGRVFEGDLPGVEELLDRGFDVDLRNVPGGWTLLHAAAFTGETEMLELLLSRGARAKPVATASENQETPLGVAIYFGHEEAADLLVSRGGGDPLPAGVEWSDIRGWGEGATTSWLDLEAIQRFQHLWFLWFLVWLLVGFAAVAWLADRRDPDRSGRGAWPRAIMWSMIPLTVLPQLYMGGGGAYPLYGPDTSDGFIPYPHVLAYYAAFFAFGALMYGRRDRKGLLIVDTIGRPWWVFLPVSFLIVFPAGLVFTFDRGLFSWPAASVLQVAYAWGMCVGLIGLFRVLLPRERSGVRYLSDSSYWLYLIHIPVVVAAQVIMRDWTLAPEVKFLVISVVATALLLLSYQLLIRYTPVGTMLNGKKVRPSKRSV